ncbi:MAG: GIY-YIG nuclease family protein [Candidatus Pacebacteria bacterium]|nr:GIY-YIG nuclease family protein [Candidatus Paceibacterota bacterium]
MVDNSHFHDRKPYVGYTSDLKERMLKYNEGRIDSTRTPRLFNLLYYGACYLENDAVSREKYLKLDSEDAFYETP